MKPRIGSLCSGYGGLDLAVMDVLGGSVAWHCQYDPEDKHQYAARILEHHWPEVPNHGDITAVDWAAVEPVDVLTAGFPCQDLSYAGRGAGIKEGNRSGLWYTIEEAVRALRPRLVVLENVAAVVTRRPGLDVVLAGLAELGLDAEWRCFRASDRGAPHKRNRWFCVAGDPNGLAWAAGRALSWRPRAVDESGQVKRVVGPDRAPAATDTPGVGWREGWPEPAGIIGGSDVAVGGVSALANSDGDPWSGGAPVSGRTSRAGTVRGRGLDGVEVEDLDAVGTGLVGDRVGVGSPVAWDEFDAESAEDGPDLRLDSVGRDAVEVCSGNKGGEGVCHGTDPLRRPLQGQQPAENSSEAIVWGPYAAAIRRWEQALGRTAPTPTMSGLGAKPRLNPAFVEWMMGLPGGHVCDVPAPPGMTPAGLRNARLKALGNGVVPQQAAHALRILLDRARGEVAA